MKRILCIVLALTVMSIAIPAMADVPQISNNLFSNAKQALVYLASGEYERLVTLLPFSDVSPSASEWQNFAEGNFSTLADGVQTDYAVAYWTGSIWKLAVPVSVPNDGSVETLVLSSADGASFNGYRYADWSQVKSEYEAAPYVTWDQEYVETDPVVTAD